ncbi:MAG: hypothetical protein IH995_08955 [Proteobacteria bacterium]|nr:hypothetical protein [Pseudomonadota bacterium]
MSQTPKIQLLYFPGCPNVEETREVLRKALENLALGGADIEDVNVHNKWTPEALRNYPSPTILVDGKDIEGFNPTDAAACRIYDGKGGVPAVKKIETFIQKTLAERQA